MLFLQDQQERRCNFPDDISMPYMNNKMDIGHQLPNYSQANYQVFRIIYKREIYFFFYK